MPTIREAIREFRSVLPNTDFVLAVNRNQTVWLLLEVWDAYKEEVEFNVSDGFAGFRKNVFSFRNMGKAYEAFNFISENGWGSWNEKVLSSTIRREYVQGKLNTFTLRIME